ncbi:MAG: helix-turn-helix domain-containing protein [Oscillospiraceae bacterium]|nr:helix-turn-helix domain-containing protein [Oscillospiraceae bacterium]
MREYNYDHPFVEIDKFKDYDNNMCSHKISGDRNVSFIKFKTPGGYTISNHFNDWFELVYISEGEAEFSIKNRSFRVLKGDFLFVDYNTAHGYSTESGVEMQCFHIKHGYLEQLIPIFDASIIMCNSADVFLPKNNYNEVKENFNKMVKHFQSDSDLDVMGFHCYLFMLIYILTRDFTLKDGKNRINQLKKSDNQIDIIIDYIHKHYNEQISLDTISEALHLSSSYISRLFKEQLNIGYKDYLNKIRLNHAVYMLTNSSKNIVDIANECGFPNNKSFIEIFKQEYGKTPSQYRKEQKRKLK